jgi:hypothetical protein
LPLATGGLLVVTLVVQLARPGPAPIPRQATADARPAISRTAAAIADYPRILTRPLFDPARGASGGGAASASASTSLGDYTLVGVASVGGRAEAVLRGPGGETISLRPGEALLGWQIAAIDHGGMVLEQGDVRRAVAVGAPAAPRTDASRTDASRTDASQIGAPQIGAPKIGAP